MARTQRLFMDNTSYHLIIRGNQKQKTFIEEEDFDSYITLLRYYKRKYDFNLYGYCLMPNHVHIVLEVKNGIDLGKIMQGLNQTYAIWFNKKYNKVGHLWQGRYKSMIIQRNKYMLDCLEYVEFNPVRANICKMPSDYTWSSWKIRSCIKKDNILDMPNL
jgi:putative transposase